MTIFTVHYAYDNRSDVRDQVRPDHRSFLGALNAAGALLSSGPFIGPALNSPSTTTTDDVEGALLIVRGESGEAVEAELDRDPFYLAGLIAERTIRPWNPVIGTWA